MCKRLFSVQLVAIGWMLQFPFSLAAQTASPQQSSFSFSSANVCPTGQNGPAPCSQTAAITFTVSGSGSLGLPKVVTEGIPNLDFTLAGGNTCSGTVSGSCTVNVTFTPRFPGLRRGAVQIVNLSGAVLATAFLSGKGIAPQIALNPGISTTFYSGSISPSALVVDAAGNVIVTETPNNRITRIAPDGTLIVLANGLNQPTRTAIDGAGNLFVITGTLGGVLKIAPNGTRSIVGSGLGSLSGIAVDGAGNIYVGDYNNNQIVKIPQDGTFQRAVSGYLPKPSSVAVDSDGNLFVVDYYQVVKVTAAGRTIPLTQTDPYSVYYYPSATSISVDAAGNVYTVTVGNYYPIELPADGTPQRSLPISGGLSAVDAAGNLYTVTTGQISVLLRSQSALLDFGKPGVGNTALASGSIENTGNDLLGGVITPFSDPNFSAVPDLVPSFDCTPSFSLKPGNSCNLNYQVIPTTTGFLEAKSIVQDNSLNAVNVTHSVRLQATGLLSQTISFDPQTASGGGIALNAVASSGLPVTYSIVSGNCYFYGTIIGISGYFGTCTIRAQQSGNSVYAPAPPVTRTAQFAIQGFLNSQQQPTGPRGDFTGFVGMRVTLGSQGLALFGLGRYVAPGNTGSHLLKIVDAATGIDLPNAFVTVSTAGLPSGQFTYGALPYTINLTANKSYYFLSQEITGGDTWYENGINPPNPGVDGPARSDGNGGYVFINAPGQAYGPVNFVSTTGQFTSIKAGLTSPAPNSIVSGNLAVTLVTDRPITSVQINRQTVPLTAGQTSPYSLTIDTTKLSNGPQTLTVTAVVNGQGSADASVPLIVQNSPAATASPFTLTPQVGAVRFDLDAYTGYRFTVGSKPLAVTSLGRVWLQGSSRTHIVKITQVNGENVPGASVAIDLNVTGIQGQYIYAPLAQPVFLQPNTQYLLVSQEYAQSDRWYDVAPIANAPVASIEGPEIIYPTFLNSPFLPGQAYAHVNFTYLAAGQSSYTYAQSPNPLTARILSPTNDPAVAGNNIDVTAVVSGSPTALQLQIDGKNVGGQVNVAPSSSSSYAFTFDSTLLTNGQHAIQVIALDLLGNTTISAPEFVVVSNQSGVNSNYLPFVLTQSINTLRNNFGGFIGLRFTVGATPIRVGSLGRYDVPGNSGVHTLKLVDAATGLDLPNGAATVSMVNGVPGLYLYGGLPAPVTLQANAAYYVVSQEIAGGDQWYNFGQVTVNNIAAVTGAAYQDTSGVYTVQSLPGLGYGLVNFLYDSALTATINSPIAGSTISGTSVPVVVAITGSAANIQLQVDGKSYGTPLSVSSLRMTLMLDTSTFSNGLHTLTVIASDGQSQSVQSSTVQVTVNNAQTGPIPTSFVVGQTLGAARNNFTGFVGFQFTVGATPLTVTSLGRFVLAGNNQSHLMKLVGVANKTDLPGGSVVVYPATGQIGKYVYEALPQPVTLQANTSYYLLTLETSKADSWYDVSPVAVTPVASVDGPAFRDTGGTTNPYMAVLNLPGQGYGPVSFLYQGPGIVVTPLSAGITSPASGATVSGSNVSVTVATTGAAASLQLQVDGTNRGAAVAVSSSPTTLTLDTTSLSNGPHTLVAVVSDGQGGSAQSTPASVTVNNVSVSGNPFVTSQTPGAARNNFAGFVGMKFTVGGSPLTITSLGRIVLSGNTGSHVIKLANASNGDDVPGGAVTVSTAGGSAGQYRYAALANAVTLSANTPYYLLSQEVGGGDTWYDFGSITVTNVATINGPAYQDGNGTYNALSLPGQSYVPLNLLYGSQSQPVTPLTATITLPTSGASVSGSSVSVVVTTTGAAASLQLQVDGTNQGSAVPVSSTQTALTLDTTSLSNGSHSLVVVVSDGQGGSAQSSAVSVTVSNTAPIGGTSTSFVTGQTLGAARNNFTGFVGMEFTVGGSSLSVTSLGRIVLSGNTGSHIVKLVNASNGIEVPGGSATVTTAGGTAGQYRYASLANVVTLSANASYYLVSQETGGGDTWCDFGPVTVTNVAAVNGPAYQDGNGTYNTLSLPGQAYVPVSFTYGSGSAPVNPTPPAGTSLITAQTPGALRNNFNGFVGFAFTTGATPLTVTSLGRLYATGNTGSHLVKLVMSNNVDVPGGSVTISLAGGTAGQYTYGTLASPIALAANTTYYLVSQEAGGGDQWYDYGSVTPASAVTITGPTYLDSGNPTITYTVVTALPNQAYGPVNLTYQ